MILDIINKKRLGQILSYDELNYIFNGYLKGEVPDYQMSSLLMAICIKGMTEKETFDLTKIFIESGQVLDFSDIKGIKVDKHSTGGIGDKTTLIIAPIASSLGVPIIKMSGRGLGVTGGTIDKLESIPGYRTDLTDKEIIKQVHDIGIVVTGQTKDLVPMDKVIYALRDVTATVSSIPLIASSIMSKKIAGGADKILIDIKHGDGALLSNIKDAKHLGDLMVKIGDHYNREVRYIISDMNTPLGTSIGNSLEVLEAINVLKGNENNNLTDLCLDLASNMVSMGLSISIEDAKEKVIESIRSGKALNKFKELVSYQGGNLNGVKISNNISYIKSPTSGTITNIDALEVGKLSQLLGAGKEKVDDVIDYTVGVKLEKLVGSHVDKGDILANIYYNKTLPNYDVNKMFKIN